MKNSKSVFRFSACLAMAVLLSASTFGGVPDPAGEVARRLFETNRDSVLWISVVAKISYTTEGATDSPMNMPDSENKFEGYGTVVSTNGLLVTALSAIDPSHAISGREITTRSGKVRLDASVIIKEVLIIMPDGVEVPAEVVMKDTDLDLAFIRAKADSKQFKLAKFVPINIKDSAKAVMAEETITLMRGDEVLNRQPSIVRGQVTVLMTKPREFVRATSGAPGTPTFNTDGKFLGIGTVRFVQNRTPTAVLLPAADVQEFAELAKTAAAKPDTKAENKGADKPESKSDAKAESSSETK